MKNQEDPDKSKKNPPPNRETLSEDANAALIASIPPTDPRHLRCLRPGFFSSTLDRDDFNSIDPNRLYRINQRELIERISSALRRSNEIDLSMLPQERREAVEQTRAELRDHVNRLLYASELAKRNEGSQLKRRNDRPPGL